MLFLRAGNRFFYLPENHRLVFSDQRPPVKRRAARCRNNRRAGIGRGDNVRQFQNAATQQRMLVRHNLPDFFDDRHHSVDGVDALFRVGGMTAHALGLDHNLGSSPLPDLDAGRRRLADDDKIRLDPFRNLARRDAFEAFLVDRAGNADRTGKVLLRLRGKAPCRHDHRAVAALHVRGAAPVNLPVRNLAAERTVRPLCLVDHIHRIDVPVH